MKPEEELEEEFDLDEEEEELPYMSGIYESDDGSWVDVSTVKGYYDLEVYRAGCFGTDLCKAYSKEELDEVLYSVLGRGIDI